MGKLTEAERTALTFLSNIESDAIREIDDENTLCAALVYADLNRRNFVTIEKGDAGCTFRITPLGLRALGSTEVGDA